MEMTVQKIYLKITIDKGSMNLKKAFQGLFPCYTTPCTNILEAIGIAYIDKFKGTILSIL